MKRLLTVIFCSCATLSFAQTINNNWKQDLNQELELLKACDDSPTTGVSPCNKFMGSALNTLYKVDDFYSKSSERYMLTAEIAAFLKNSDKWTLLGRGYEQKALHEAQNYANAKKAAIAIYVNEEGLGHVAIIAPGDLRLSGTWGFQVPNSVSFFPAEKSKSYVDKSLSYAFAGTQIKSVLIYGRKY